ncbi:signal transduction histidine kinase [Sphingomonas insulae]|uniref:histidine kinase n=1 Tax=Sphingomonas insulae TaxID=424800 RepID=A0ABP3T208_9SPHN|nr:ATP-binding protein [Sphingomonas insulae]NIJ29464.1 signal transduction histidine kinase [Sphingomonas insulae]
MATRMTMPMLAFAAASLAVPAVAQGVGPDRFDALVADAKATMLVDPHRSVDKAREAEAFAARQPPSTARSLMGATAMWLHGEALMRLGDARNAKPLIDGAVRVAASQAPGSKLNGDALLSRGWINTVQARVAAALGDYQRAHAIFQALGETRSQAKALQAIGSLYVDANDNTNALRYFDQALSVYKSDPMLALTLYNNRGNALNGLDRFHEAEAQFRQALALTETIGSPMLRVLVLGNIAEARLLDHDVAGAQRAIDEGLRLSSGGEAVEYRHMLVALAAQAAFQRGDLPAATQLIDQRFAGEDFAKSTLNDREAHRTAYMIYSRTGAHDLALQHLVTLKRLDDEATTLARSTGAALMAARFDFANQELKIANLQRDEARRNVAFEQARTRTQRNIFLGVAAAAALIVALLAFGIVALRRSRNKVRAANADLAVTNTALGKALAAKTEFLATTSHEIRTPLNGILGMTQVMLADRGVAGATRDRLTVVHSAGITMRALVDDILDVAKMETGNLVIEAAPFDLDAMLRDSTRLWDDQARAKGLTFTRDLATCPGMIVGDAVRLRQIVFNLMSNALKFTATGGVSLRVATAGDDRLQIMIEDTGVGIAPDKCDEIFESFRQADTSTTRQFGGTGLGLSICRNLARAMGGDVTVASTPGAGSRFTVDLPLVRAPSIDAAGAGAGAGAAPGLLIVERSPITRSMLKTLLLPHAGEVAVAASLDEALPILERGGVERLLVDAAVLSATGDVATAANRLVQAAGAARIVVLWPADSDPDRDGIAMKPCFTNVIKPVSGASLVASVYPPDDLALVSRAA